MADEAVAHAAGRQRHAAAQVAEADPSRALKPHLPRRQREPR